tara:strand:+ start:256 stop:360 length:105 start_codon:yes stop_codon:yes gene_type:complete
MPTIEEYCGVSKNQNLNEKSGSQLSNFEKSPADI